MRQFNYECQQIFQKNLKISMTNQDTHSQSYVQKKKKKNSFSIAKASRFHASIPFESIFQIVFLLLL